MQAARVFITGGAGFIGSHLVQALTGTCDVFVFDNLSPRAHRKNTENLARVRKSGARVFLGDIRDVAALTDAVALARPDVVVHLAAETGTGESYDQPSLYCQVNVDGTAHLIDALRSAGPPKRLLLASTRAVYGEGAYVDDFGCPAMALPRLRRDLEAGDFQVYDKQRRPLTAVPTSSTQAPSPVSVYASSKLMQEHLLTQAFWGSETQVCSFRLQNIFGPSQSLTNPYTGVLSCFAQRIAAKASLDIYEDGGITRDFLYVSDAAAALACAVHARDLPTVLDIGSGERSTILAVAQAMLAKSGQPMENARISGRFRPGDIRHAWADISEAQRVLDWRPQVKLRDGLSRLLGWSAEMIAA